jgi:hypothetical protein
MTENEIQAQFVWWARKQLPDVPIFAVPNGGHRGKTQGAMLKATGVLAGVPDLFVADGRPGLFIELKTATGRLSEAQKGMIEKLNTAGYPVAVCYSLEEAKAAFINYLESK